jgi:hypothetical protein
MIFDIVLIMLLVLVPTVLQLMAISVYTERLGRSIRRSADKPPFTTIVEIVDVGPEPRAVARLLDRATRLDQDEVDHVIAQRGGRLPLPMSRSTALRLVAELRQLGATADTSSVIPKPGVQLSH